MDFHEPYFVQSATLFSDDNIKLDVLRKRAHNLRWATQDSEVIPLTAADPDFPCAPEIVDSIQRYSSEGYFSYGPSEGLPEFKNALSNRFRDSRNVPVNEEWVLPVDSAAFGIYLVCLSLLNPGDEAIIFNPVDFLFKCSIEQVGSKAVSFPIPPGSEDIDFNQLESYINENTRLICLCNPLNPTGKVFTRVELSVLGEIAIKHDLMILSDEIWSEIIFEPHEFTSLASLNEEVRKQTITVTGFSKSYGLAGLRIGAVVAHDESIFQLLYNHSLHGFTIHGANTLSQIAATTAMTQCDYWLNEFVQHNQRMRNMIVSELNTIAGFNCIPPEGCYVAFVDIRGTGKTSQEIHDLLLTKGKVAVVPGLEKWFGSEAEGFIRICFSTSERILRESIQRIKYALA